MKTLSNFFERSFLETKSKLEKLKSKVERKISTGEFQSLKTSKKKLFQKRIFKLEKQLKHFQVSLKLGVTCGALLLSLNGKAQEEQRTPFFQNKNHSINYSHTNQLHGKETNSEVFVLRSGSENPLAGTNPYANYTFNLLPILTDIDGDSDYDVVDYNYDNGTFIFYEAQVENNYVTLTELTGEDNPFNNIFFENVSWLEQVDIDNDSDFDFIFIGESNVRFFLNEGDAQNPNLVEKTDNENPFNAINEIPLDFTDIDADGDLDFFANSGYGISFFENTGSATNPVFEGTVTSMFDAIGSVNPTTMSFADIDNDGDYDAVVSDYYLSHYSSVCFRNEGTPTEPQFALDDQNPFQSINFFTQNYLIDVDEDNDFDVFSSDQTCILFFDNIGTPQEMELISQNGANGENFIYPVFTDIDDDGDFDLLYTTVTNHYYISAQLFENIGTAQQPEFEQADINNSPFAVVLESEIPIFEFADFDNDGDQDMIHSAYNNENETCKISYYENQGSAAAPNFIQLTGNDNPLDLFEAVTTIVLPQAADIDNDGDIDVFLGYGDYSIEKSFIAFYENTGTPEIPAFELKTSPFGTYELRSSPQVSFTDLDIDGDLDAFVGGYYGNIQFFQNIGDAQTPLFEERFGDQNPMNEFPESIPFLDLVDIDADSDNDLFVGNINSILFYENIASYVGNQNIVEKVEIAQIQPNPFVENLMLTFNADGQATVNVYNLQGKTVFTEQFNVQSGTQKEISFNENSNGLYFVKIQIGENSQTFKVQKFGN